MNSTMGFANPTLAGNVLSIPPGTYSGIQMSDKSIDGPLVIDGKGATFTGTIFLPRTLKEVDFINFSFQGVPDYCFHWENNQVKVGLDKVRFLSCSAFDCGAFCLIGSRLQVTEWTSMSKDTEVVGITINKPRKPEILYVSKSENLKIYDITVDGRAWTYDPAAKKPTLYPTGPDVTILIPQDYILLPPPPNHLQAHIAPHLWERVEGPPCKLAHLQEPLKGFAVAKDLVEGKYVFKLTVTDGQNKVRTYIKNVFVKQPSPVVTGLLFSDGSSQPLT